MKKYFSILRINWVHALEYRGNALIGLFAILSESDLQKLLSILLKNSTANNISFEDIPVDDAMRNFFQNPEKYIK